VVTKILEIRDDHAELHVGNYSEWKSRAPTPAPAAAPAKPKAEVEAEPEAAADGGEAQKRRRIEDREKAKADQREVERKKKRFAELEEKIAALETDIGAMNEKLAADHGGDWQKLHGLVADREKLEGKLKSYLGEWERLGLELET
jgi:flagellar motility protein MotE (MotC chaperone)